MNIITLTLSPAFDIHAAAVGLEIDHENFATVLRREAGGKGVNISRALTKNGYENTAVVVVGQENGTEFSSLLEVDGVKLSVLSVPGRIRENLTVHTEGGKETRISFSGFSADASVLAAVAERVDALMDSDCIVTLTGSLPVGLKMQDVQAFLRDVRQKGAKLVVDSRSFSTEDLMEAKPWLIKPNEEEIAQYAGRSVETVDEIAAVARAFCARGIENVMVTLGARGAILVNEKEILCAEMPKVEVKSTIGAGDSSIAGFLAAYSEGKDRAQCFRRAMAYGAAACMQEGTRAPEAGDIQEVSAKIKLHRMR